jgi:cation/acetate symporter
VSERDEVRVARIAAFVIGGAAIALAIPAQNLNIAFLVALAFAVAASANLPSLLYNLFWRRFNTRGATWSIYGGLIMCVGLVFFSPVVSGSETAMFPSQDWQWFPLSNPGIISIPFGFLMGFIGSITSTDSEAESRHGELQVRALTGAGSEKAVQH